MGRAGRAPGRRRRRGSFQNKSGLGGAAGPAPAAPALLLLPPALPSPAVPSGNEGE